MSQKRQPEESCLEYNMQLNKSNGPCGGGGGGEAGGSSSSSFSLHYRPGKLKGLRVALRDVITEVMWNASIDKFFMAIEPLIRRVVKEEIESAFVNHASMMERHSPMSIEEFAAAAIFTGFKIEGEGSLSVTIALVDTLTRQVVASGKESLMKVEIVVLEGDSESGEDDDWTAQEFTNNIVKERGGKRPLVSGYVYVGLIDGIRPVGELSFTDNSSWTWSRKFRLGARTEDGCFNGIKVWEAKTKTFVVKDH